MIYVFHLKVLAACDILSKAVDHTRDPSMFRMAAIALSSFNADRSSVVWQQQRALANSQIQDPHLRAIFAFLITDNDNFETVLVSTNEAVYKPLLFLYIFLDGERSIAGRSHGFCLQISVR